MIGRSEEVFTCLNISSFDFICVRAHVPCFLLAIFQCVAKKKKLHNFRAAHVTEYSDCDRIVHPGEKFPGCDFPSRALSQIVL